MLVSAVLSYFLIFLTAIPDEAGHGWYRYPFYPFLIISIALFIKEYFTKKGLRYEDVGPYKLDKDDDYSDFAFRVGEKVAHDNTSRGILICGSGAGVVIAANKVKGIRAVNVADIKNAKLSREHIDANIIGFSAWNLPFNKMKKIVDVWLNTPFSNLDRHRRRINKISNYESRR